MEFFMPVDSPYYATISTFTDRPPHLNFINEITTCIKLVEFIKTSKKPL